MEQQSRFGTISDIHVELAFARHWWFPRPSRVHVPLDRIASVQYRIHRRWAWGWVFVLFAMSAGSMARVVPEVIPVTVLWVLTALYLWTGSPQVIVRTQGGDVYISGGRPWHRHEAALFTSALLRTVQSRGHTKGRK